MGRLILLAFLLFSGAAIAAPAAEYTVEVTGHGADILMLPGLASSGDVWTASAAALAKNHRVHRFTLAGFAGVPAVAGDTVEQRVAALAGYLKTNHITNATIVGHSLGGYLALKLALAAPDAVSRIVIADSLPFLGQAFVGAPDAASAQAPAAAIRDKMIATPREQFLASQKGQIAALVTSPENQALVYSWAEKSDQKAVAEAVYQLLTADSRAEIAGIKAKTLVLYPFQPGRFTAEQTDGFYGGQYAALAGVKLVRIDDSKHFLMLDQPEKFLAAVTDFLAH